MSEGTTRAVFAAFAGNMAIALTKAAAAAITGSGALVAETAHSIADSLNQILLYVGIRRSVRPPTERHPLGHGKERYFWALVVALLLFFGGGVFSLLEALERFQHAREITQATEKPAPPARYSEWDKELVLEFLAHYHDLGQALVQAGFTRPGQAPGILLPNWEQFAPMQSPGPRAAPAAFAAVNVTEGEEVEMVPEPRLVALCIATAAASRAVAPECRSRKCNRPGPPLEST